MQPRYFFGQEVNGQVKETTAQNFKDLVDRYLNIPVPLPFTHAQFMAMAKPQRDQAKRVPYLVPAVFKHSPSRRRYEDAMHCNLVFLDIDEAPDGTCPAAVMLRNPETLAAQLAPFSFAVYTTASSTLAKPRLRIMVDADSIPLASYALAVKTIAKRIALPQITSESKVAVQPMFLPCLFEGQTEAEHPLIICEVDGAAFGVADITGDAGYQATPQRGASPENISLDDLEFLRPPVEEITLPVAVEALGHVDPDISYPEWFEIAASLRHQFTPRLEDEAYQAFDDWSSAGSKYKDDHDTRAQWSAVHATPVGRVPVTIRSLLRLAVAGGWDASPIKELCFNSTLGWLQNVAANANVLLSEGIKKIIATPLLSASEEDALLQQIVSTAKKRFKMGISVTALRKDLLRLKNTIKEKEQTTGKASVPSWCKGLVFVAKANSFFRHHTGETYSPEPFDLVYGKRLLPSHMQLQEAGTAITPASLSRPMVRPRDFALNHVKIPAVYDFEYNPSAPNDLFTIDAGKIYVNTYVRCHPTPKQERASHAGQVLMQHLKNLIAEPEYIKTLLDFFAYMVQFPGKKIRWGILMQGVQGCGKSFLSEVMATVLGQRHVESINGEAIFSGFNEWASGRQLVSLEEVRIVGVNRHEVMNVLKPLITNSCVSIMQKFRDVRQILNRTNYILYTNFHDAIAITADDRRYFVVKSKMQTKESVRKLGTDYFENLYDVLREDAGGLRWFFENWKISNDFPANGPAPVTRYMHQLVNDSASELTATVRKLISEGDHPLLQADILSSKVLLEMLHDQEDLRRTTGQLLASVLRDENYLTIGRFMINDERHYLWIKEGFAPEHPEAVAAERLKNGSKNLCTDLLF